MSDTNGGLMVVLANVSLAFVAGLLGIFTGVKVHDAKLDQFEKRLDRIEAKLDRVLEKHYL